MGDVLSAQLRHDVLVVVPRVARLDAAAARPFKAAVEAAWSSGVRSVEVDLAAVEFVDSSGIGALLHLYRRLPADGGGSTRLVGVRPSVRAVIEMLRLHRVFEVA